MATVDIEVDIEAATAEAAAALVVVTSVEMLAVKKSDAAATMPAAGLLGGG